MTRERVEPDIGGLRALSGVEYVEHLRQIPVRLWATDGKDHWLKITAERMTRRAFGPPS